ncbi:MAG TPA: glycoside hydrolase family 38 C-terminal domain-containing protein [Chloroflexota bacterium]|nr:glycoside hydrolase family 38 C-terminal domain-containing protein [Chloroflexota bacterium]
MTTASAGQDQRLPPHTLHVISHTHWDREWYLTFQHFRMRLVRTVDELLRIFESERPEDRDYVAFHLDGQAVVLEDYLEIRPDNRERLARQIQAGKILVGPWYILPDEFLISGESHIRNLIVGQQEVSKLGPSMRLGYLPDLFGHISQMPQLLADAGFDTAVLWRGLSGEREGLKSELFWEAPDGSRVLCIHLPEQSGYSNANNLALDPETALERIRALRAERATFATTEHLLLMNGTDHHGAQRALPGLLHAVNERLSSDGAQLVHATLPDYVQAVRSTLDLPDEPFTVSLSNRTPPETSNPIWHAVDPHTNLQIRRGELRDVNRSGVLYSNFLLYGVASARVYIKQANHRAQQALERYAEPWSSVAWLLGAPYPQGLLRQSWKYLLQNHPHDSICGCSIDPVHEQMMTRFQWSNEIADGLTTEALHQLTRHAARPELDEGAVAIRLFNPLPWPRDEVVEVTAYFPPDSVARAFEVRDPDGNVFPSVVRQDEVKVRTVEHSDMKPAPRHPRSREVTLAFRAHLPALGYSTSTVHPLTLPSFDRPAAIVTAQPTYLANDHLRVAVTANGTLNVTQLASGRELHGLLAFEDGADVGDEYTYSPPQRDQVISSVGASVTTSLVERSPTVGRLRIDLILDVPAEAAPDRRSRSERTVPLRISTILTLAAGSRRLECETTVDNLAKDHRLRVLFPHIALAGTHHVDQAFDVVERPNDYPATPAEFWNEDAPDTHPQRLFVDLSDGSGGLALLNQGIVEYGITGRPGEARGLALTLLRSVAYLGAGAYPSTIRSGAGPPLETPGAQCLGTLTFRYALVPHAGDWQSAGILKEAINYNTPPTSYPVEDSPLPWVPPWASVNQRRNAAALAAQQHADLPDATFGLTESFLSIEGDVILSALKRAEAPDENEGGDPGGPLLLRLYNPTDQAQPTRLTFRRPIVRARRASILEQPAEDLPLQDGALPLTVPPKKIVTLLLDIARAAQP